MAWGKCWDSSCGWSMDELLLWPQDEGKHLVVMGKSGLHLSEHCVFTVQCLFLKIGMIHSVNYD